MQETCSALGGGKYLALPIRRPGHHIRFANGIPHNVPCTSSPNLWWHKCRLSTRVRYGAKCPLLLTRLHGNLVDPFLTFGGYEPAARTEILHRRPRSKASHVGWLQIGLAFAHYCLKFSQPISFWEIVECGRVQHDTSCRDAQWKFKMWEQQNRHVRWDGRKVSKIRLCFHKRRHLCSRAEWRRRFVNWPKGLTSAC